MFTVQYLRFKHDGELGHIWLAGTYLVEELNCLVDEFSLESGVAVLDYNEVALLLVSVL